MTRRARIEALERRVADLESKKDALLRLCRWLDTERRRSASQLKRIQDEVRTLPASAYGPGMHRILAILAEED